LRSTALQTLAPTQESTEILSELPGGSAAGGRAYVADPETPGMQADAVPAPVARPVHAGRLVTRAEKWSAELGEFASGWASIEAGKASKLQRARLK
jgi:hypothetical protein